MKRKLIKQNRFIFTIKEFCRFIRVETCLFASGIAASGYIFFNTVSYNLPFLLLAIFLATAGGYAYNHLTDREEDAVNDRRLNVFVTNGLGMKLVVTMFVSSILFSLFLPPLSFLLAVMSIPIIIAYSAFRVKKIFLVKNVYTGLTMGLAFMIGVCAKGIITNEILFIFFAAFLFAAGGNLLGDIRGHAGDLAAGAKTLPTVIGIDASKTFVHLIFLGFSTSILVSRYYLLFPFVPFGFLISFFLAMERHKAARYSMLSSFVTFSGFLFFEYLAGGG